MEDDAKIWKTMMGDDLTDEGGTHTSRHKFKVFAPKTDSRFPKKGGTMK